MEEQPLNISLQIDNIEEFNKSKDIEFTNLVLSFKRGPISDPYTYHYITLHIVKLLKAGIDVKHGEKVVGRTIDSWERDGRHIYAKWERA